MKTLILLLLLLPIIVRANPAVLIVDMQEFFLQGPGHAEIKEQLIGNQVEFLHWAKSKKLPVMVFEYNYFGKVQPWTVIPEISNLVQSFETYKFIYKNKDSGFSSESTSYLEALKTLEEWGVDELVVFGVNGSYCVADSMRDALSLNLRIVTADDLVADIGTFDEGTSFPFKKWKSLEDNPSFLSMPSYVHLIRKFEESVARPYTSIAP